MKILCETQIVNRHTQGVKSRTQKSTLAIGFHTTVKDASGSSKKELEMMLFTSQQKTGMRYKVQDNVEKIYTKFILDGKATISLLQPPENIMIKCNPIELKGFLQTLKLGLEGKNSMNLRLNIAAATAIPQKSHPQTRMVIAKRSDYPTKGFPKTLQSLSITNIKLMKITFDICSLVNLTKLDLCCNNIRKLPPELGRLALKELLLNNNLLGKTNSWQCLSGKTLQKSLRELDLSVNQITHFPQEIMKLENLVKLKFNNNLLRRVPFGLRRMRCLRSLHLSSNLLESLPSSFNDIRLDILDIWGNNFQPHCGVALGLSDDMPRTQSVPPLWVAAARAVSQYRIPYTPATLPWTLCDKLADSPICACGYVCMNGQVYKRSGLVSFENIARMIFSRDRLVYTDIVVCGSKCLGLKEML